MLEAGDGRIVEPRIDRGSGRLLATSPGIELGSGAVEVELGSGDRRGYGASRSENAWRVTARCLWLSPLWCGLAAPLHDPFTR